MTLGKKLQNYRKVAGLTQQQLADHLNLSPQAISKWENDFSEPDLASLKEIAKLYNTSLDTLLDLNSDVQDKSNLIDADAVLKAVSNTIDEKLSINEKAIPIGYCKNCGIAVTDENLAESSPVIICKSCKEAKERAEQEKIEADRRAEERKRASEEFLHKKNMSSMSHHLKKSLIVATIVAIPIFIFALSALFASEISVKSLLLRLLLTYAGFAFTFTMFYDTFIKDFVEYMFGASINWPGLIFTFDLDGFIWLIGMKILFAVLGFLFGLLAAAIGVSVGALLSMIGFPFILAIYKHKIATGQYSDPELE